MNTDEDENDTVRIGDKRKGKQVPVGIDEKDEGKMYLTAQGLFDLQILQFFRYMFPSDYEFYENDVEQLSRSLDVNMWAKLDERLLQFSRIDHSTGIPMYNYKPEKMTAYNYKPEKMTAFYDLSSGAAAYLKVEEYLRINDVVSSIPKTARHVSVRGSIDSNFLRNLYVAEELQTLLILRGAGRRINCLPHDLFQKLPSLQVLDLSHTDITELPSSIGYAPQLRYLNLSFTSLVELPTSLCNILTLQILKLRGCLKLRGLPKAIRRLRSLRHLDVDVSCLLVSMPPGVGELRRLKTLPAFVIGKKQGWHIEELKNLNDVHQTLRILRLENVSSREEANRAILHKKCRLEKLEFHWSQFVDGFEVLESLHPSKSITELEIRGYGGAKFPIWIESNFFSLTAITIHNCSKCNALPTLGRLRSLKLLHISDMNEVKVIAPEFHGDRYSKDIVFPCLEQLTFNGMPELSEWIGVKKNDFPVLQRLSISACSKLTALPELSFFQSLQQLEISLCSSLASFPAGGLPISLESIVIIECPELKARCQKDVGEDWGKLSHIPNILIDYQEISGGDKAIIRE